MTWRLFIGVIGAAQMQIGMDASCPAASGREHPGRFPRLSSARHVSAIFAASAFLPAKLVGNDVAIGLAFNVLRRKFVGKAPAIRHHRRRGHILQAGQGAGRLGRSRLADAADVGAVGVGGSHSINAWTLEHLLAFNVGLKNLLPYEGIDAYRAARRNPLRIAATPAPTA